MSYVVPDPEYCLTSLRLPNFVAWIKVDNKPIRIHARSGQQESVTGYIEGEEGKRYEAYYADLRTAAPNHGYVTTLHIDGIEVEGTAVEKEDEGFKSDFDDPWRFQEYSTIKVNHRSTGRPLTFEKVASADEVDDEVDESSTSEASTMRGTIRLEYRRVKRIKEVNKSRRAKVATLGFDYLEQDIEEPFVRFDFRYRTAASLLSHDRINMPSILFENPILALQKLDDNSLGKLETAINSIKAQRRYERDIVDRARSEPVDALTNAMSLDFILESSTGPSSFANGASGRGESSRNLGQFGLPSVYSATSPPTI